MNAIFKSTLLQGFKSGLSIADLAFKYGFSEKQVEEVVRPQSKVAGAGTVVSTVISVKQLTRDELKKIKQKNAGKKAAATRLANKQKKESSFKLGREIFKKEDFVLPAEEHNTSLVIPKELTKSSESKTVFQSDSDKDVQAKFLIKSICSDLERLLNLFLTK